MTTVPARGHAARVPAALTTVLAMLLVLLVPSAAQAATTGGETRGTAVPLPISSFDESFTASNTAITTGFTGEDPFGSNVAWYSVTPLTTTTMFIRATSISPAGWDNTLTLWTDTRIAMSDDSYGRDAALTVTLNAGTTYYLGLGGFGGPSRGTAELSFSSRVPSAPTSVTATVAGGNVDVSWEAPSDVAGGVTSYRVYCAPGGDLDAEFSCATVNGAPPQLSRTISGLANGREYTFRVTAANVLGPGDPSASSSAVGLAAPSTTTVTTEPAVPVSGQPFDVVVQVAAGGGPASGTIDLSVAGATTAGLVLADGEVRVSGIVRAAGPVALVATYSGSTVATPSSRTLTPTVIRASQTVTFAAVPGAQVYGAGPTALVASASSSLPVTFSATGPCEVTEDSLAYTGVGTCTVTATQAGDSQTEPASASQAVEVGKRSQSVALDALPALVYGQEPITLTPTSSVGLPVSLAATGACTLTGSVLAATDVGACEVTATQAGDGVTLAASATVRSTTVARRPQTVTLTPLGELTFGMAPRTMVATSEFGLPVTTTATGACAFVDGKLRVIGAGSCTVTASADGDAVTLPGSAATSGQVAAVPTAVAVDLGVELGADVVGAPVIATGTGLLPGSELVLEVRSTPQVIGRATVGADGTAVVRGVLPALEAGNHHLVALATALDGSVSEQRLGFAVSAAGDVVRIGTASLPADANADAVPTLARTGVDGATTGALAALWITAGACLILLRRRISRPAPAPVAAA